MINIYDKTETVFNHSGLATLEPIECVFAPMINDVWKLELTLPYDSDEKYKTVQNDRLIRVTDLDAVSEQSSTQIFRIYDYKKESSSVYVLAYPVALDARFEAIADHLDLRNKSASDAIAVINNMAAKYTVTTDLTTTNTAEYDNVNMIEALNGENGFVQKWGGDICYDNYNIKVREALGNQNSNFDIRYGKNIQAMSIEEDTSNVITRIYPKSSRGDIFNAIEQYAIGETRYIDSQYIDMNLIHNYFVEVPHTLVTLSDDGSEEYLRSQHYYENIFTNAQTAINVLTNTILRGGGSYSPNINLEWIAWFATLTFEQNGTEGFAERVARLACVNCVDDDYKELVSKAVHDAFSDYFSTIISDTSYDWVEHPTSYGTGFAYCPDDNLDWRWKDTWIKDGNKWKYVDADGYYYEDAEHEATRFDWYKKKGLKYKRYGKKSKEPKKGEVEHFKWYLHDEHYKLNDVWYYFNSHGKGIKGKNLLTTAGLMGLYDGVVEYIQSNVEEGEAGLFELLYTQMYNHCINMFTEDRVDIPTVNMEIDVVDLSKTTEYKDYEGLLKIHLGDKVKCVNYKLDRISTERVIGLEYDVIRGYNRKVYIGETTNSVINMLNISNSEQVKLVPGDGIEINNNVISVKPQPSGVKDVIVNGESVVIGDIASFDLDEPIIEGTGLEYFVETENTISGDEYITEHKVIWDDSFDASAVSVNYDLGTNSYKVGVSATPINKVICATVENVLIYSVASAGMASTPGFMMLSKNQEDVVLDWHYIDRNGGVDSTGTCAYSTASLNTHTLLCYELYYQSGTCTVNNETWYGIIIYLLHGGMVSEVRTGFAPTINKYVGGPGNIETFQTFSALMSEFVGDLRTETTVSKTIYNGIARKNKLAFFAGGEDDEGLNAPIKIWANGDYKGITKAVEITKADYDALSSSEKLRDDRVYFIKDYPSVVVLDTNPLTINAGDYTTATFTQQYLESAGIDTSVLKEYIIGVEWMSANVNTIVGSQVWNVTPLSVDIANAPSYFGTQLGAYTSPLVRVFDSYVEVSVCNVNNDSISDSFVVRLIFQKVR